MRLPLRPWAALLITLLAAPAGAKVAFTGYGEVEATADSYIRIRGPAALPGLTEGNLIRKGFELDSAGIFASTKIGEDAEFLMDITYEDIGRTVDETRIQYAYLQGGLPWWGLRGQLGRVTIPFNFYNTRRFYPFQRVELSAPLYMGAVLGLPIADTGAVLSRRFELSDGWALNAQVYAINGYGHSSSTAALRSPSVPGGVIMAGNLRPTNNNKDIATGGQLAFGREGDGEMGFSYYRGAWSPDDRGVLQMAGAHAHWTPGRFDVLAEYLHLHATRDEGMRQSLGSPNWATHGALLTVSRPVLRIGERELIGWGRAENYHTGRARGGPGREVLRTYSGGAAIALNEHLMLKGEGRHLYYTVPTNTQAIAIEGRIIRFSAVVTF